MLKMPSTVYAETLFFKKSKNTSQKSTHSYRTAILQKHPFSTVNAPRFCHWCATRRRPQPVVGLRFGGPEAGLKMGPLMTSSYSANRDKHF